MFEVYTIKGVTELSKKFNVPFPTITTRMSKGMTLEEALLTPTRK